MRSYFWWPALNSEIEKMCKSCEQCTDVRVNSPKTFLRSWPITEGLWERIHLDFLGPYRGKLLLLIVDSSSKWVEVFVMPLHELSINLEKLRHLFAPFCSFQNSCNGQCDVFYLPKIKKKNYF